jgi:hypothetical protein
MRKVKITPNKDGSFTIQGGKEYPELKGKKLVILTKGRFHGEMGEEGAEDFDFEGDEALLLTEEEYEAVQAKIKSDIKGDAKAK